MAQISKRRKSSNSLVHQGEALAELARLNRVLRTLSAGHRWLLRCGDEQQLLQGMCEVVVVQGAIATPVCGMRVMMKGALS